MFKERKDVYIYIEMKKKIVQKKEKKKRRT